MNMNMCTCLAGRWNADVILRLQQLLQLQARSNVCRCSAKSLKKNNIVLSLTDRLVAAILTSFHIYVFFEPKAIKTILQMCFRDFSAAKEELISFFSPRHAEVRPCWHWPTLSSSLPWGPTSFSDLYLLRARLMAEQLWHHKSLWKKNFEHL